MRHADKGDEAEIPRYFCWKCSAANLCPPQSASVPSPVLPFPAEATDEMVEAGYKAFEEFESVGGEIGHGIDSREHRVWRAMLAAAPSHELPSEFLRISDLIGSIDADRYGKPLIAALHLCNDLADELLRLRDEASGKGKP